MEYHNKPSVGRASRRRHEEALDILPKRASATTAFVSRFIPGMYGQLEVVRTAIAAIPYTVPERRAAECFLVHVMDSAERKGDGFVPVPAKLIERHYRRLDYRYLEEDGILHVRPYDRAGGLCREFAVAGSLRWPFHEAGPTAERVFRDGFCNLVSGLQTTRRVRSDRRTPSGNALPRLIRAAIDAFGEVPIRVYAIEQHLLDLREAIATANDDGARLKAEYRYMNDLRCYHAVLAQNARPLDPDRPDDLWTYQPAYKSQRFGRLSQKGGGLQSCSGAMKAVAYPDIYS